MIRRRPVAIPGHTPSAWPLLYLALDRGKQDALKERLLAAVFTDGAPIGDAETPVPASSGAQPVATPGCRDDSCAVPN